ncbi:hypothetical protein J6590_060874 [Homalodisca vitripennis]|nr:hypothetical protein J6590_060874 [Homalodisca vitripennis]
MDMRQAKKVLRFFERGSSWAYLREKFRSRPVDSEKGIQSGCSCRKTRLTRSKSRHGEDAHSSEGTERNRIVRWRNPPVQRSEDLFPGEAPLWTEEELEISLCDYMRDFVMNEDRRDDDVAAGGEPGSTLENQKDQKGFLEPVKYESPEWEVIFHLS